VPTKSFAGETVIVTGSNTGLGLEGARHIARLGPERLILAVRTLEKGQRAAADICRTTGLSKDAIHVWQLDLSKYDSIQKFAARVDAELPRLDVVIENAGILTENFVWAEDDESTIKTNVLGTMFLAILLLPKQRQTAEQFNKDVVHTFTGSWMHWTTDFAERHAPNVFAELADDKKAKMSNNER
jgi:NAD(P)-dependent dehydrogenase (short-subunit alcohol dehydrogenase family)